MSPPGAGRRCRLSRLFAAAALGSAAALLLVGSVAIVLLRDPLPPLTQADLDEAIRRWKQHGPADYELDLQITAGRPGPVHVEVKDGAVTAMTRDGRTPAQQRVWQYWSVPGQFDTIQQDLLSAADPRGGFGAPPGTQVVMRAQFDPELGYPRRYRRLVVASGMDLEVEWEVTQFVNRSAVGINDP